MLINRRVELQVGNTLVKDLDISFEIEKSLQPEPNTAHIAIWNLNQGNRIYLSQQAKIPVELSVGYGDEMALIFQGDLVFCKSERVGPDWQTSLISGDGTGAAKECLCEDNFGQGTPLCDVALALTKCLKVSTADAESLIRSNLKGVLLKATCLSGPSFPMLRKLLDGQGLETSIQDGALQILPKGQPLQHEAIVLDQETGLLHGPTHPEAEQISIQTLILPTLYPGRLIQLQSNLYRIESMRLEGDSFGGRWEAEIGAQLQR